jgi:hypothetical protein
MKINKLPFINRQQIGVTAQLVLEAKGFIL